MPKADYYAGLPLAEKLEKLVEHHHDRAVRHISVDEAAIISEAVARLRRGPDPQARAAEFDEVWRQLDHRYETLLWSAQLHLGLVATSVPSRGRPLPATASALVPEDWIVASAPTTPRLLQLALNITLRKALDESVDLHGLWLADVDRRSPPTDRYLGPSENELLNRALYQPTVAVENSPPSFQSVAQIVSTTAQGGWLALVYNETHSPATVIAAGGVLLVISVSKTVVGSAAQGLGDGLKERLYEWSRPKTANTRQAPKKSKAATRPKRK